MRRAELVMAIVLAVLSGYLMWKSTELPIGWVFKRGPGGGAFPFWLSVGMLLCCVWIIVRWFRRTSPPSRSTDSYMDKHALVLFLIGAGALTVMIGLIHFIGVYGAIPLFLLFYMRYIGRHPWPVTATLAIATPVVTFLFFEVVLKITLPKGVSAIEETVFYPLFAIFF